MSELTDRLRSAYRFENDWRNDEKPEHRTWLILLEAADSIDAMQEEIAALREHLTSYIKQISGLERIINAQAAKVSALEKVAEAGRQLRTHFVLMLEDDDQEPERWAEYFAIKAAYDSALREAGYLKEEGR